MAASQNTKTLSSTTTSIKFLCSYGGKILPRPSDGRLRYVGGLTRVVTVNRSVTFSELIAKMCELCGYTVSLRCQLPSEDLDVLVSIKSDEDLANVIEEYDKASLMAGRELKIRVILSPPKSPSSPSSLTSSPSSSSADLSPLSSDVSRSPPKSAVRRCFPASKAQFGVARSRRCYNYHPCHIQANSRPFSYSQHSNHWH